MMLLLQNLQFERCDDVPPKLEFRKIYIFVRLQADLLFLASYSPKFKPNLESLVDWSH